MWKFAPAEPEAQAVTQLVVDGWFDSNFMWTILSI